MQQWENVQSGVVNVNLRLLEVEVFIENPQLTSLIRIA